MSELIEGSSYQDGEPAGTGAAPAGIAIFGGIQGRRTRAILIGLVTLGACVCCVLPATATVCPAARTVGEVMGLDNLALPGCAPVEPVNNSTEVPPTNVPTEIPEVVVTEFTVTPSVTVGESSGKCTDSCQSDAECAEGFVCLPSGTCWTQGCDQAIVSPTAVQPTLTVQACTCQGVDLVCSSGVSYNNSQCGGGGVCECRGQHLYCPDGNVAQFNPICTGGGGSSTPAPYCGNGVCEPAAGETCWNCLDCGIC